MDLTFLTLNNNQLSGDIPYELCDMYLVDLSNNMFCSAQPDCLFANELGEQDCTGCSQTDGDLNHDEILDVLDIVATVNCILSGSCSVCSDFNEDQGIDVLDIILMVSLIINF